MECMPVQEKVFSSSLTGGDVLVQSQTGSGKTAAFLLTILETFAKQKENTKTRALVVVPTRELAVQIEDDGLLLLEGLPGIRIGSFFGGIGYQEQEKLLRDGADIVIGTPGRLIDFSKSGKIDFTTFTIVVIDEADRLFDMGFYPDIRLMLNKMRPREERQTMLFSATLSTRVRNLAWDFMNNPATVEVESERITVEEIRQELYHVSKNEKFELLLYILAKHNLDNAIIFTNTKLRAVEVAKRLEINGYHVQFLMGDLPQRKRLKVIEQMKSGENKFLVATDVAARGLHVDDLQLVVNYDIPEDFENYVHRIGRTARAGKTGLAVTLACEEFVYGLEAIQDYIGMKIPVNWLEDGVLSSVEDKSAGIHFRTLIKGTEVDRGYSREGRRNDRSGSMDSRNRGSSRMPTQSGSRSGSRISHGKQTADSSRKSSTSAGVPDSTLKKSASTKSSGSGTPPTGKSAGSLVNKPAGQSAGRTASKSASQSAGRTASKPASQSAGRTANKPAGQSAGRTANKPTGKNSDRTNRNYSKRPAADNRKDVDYSAISALPLEERLAYYKKNIGSSVSDSDKNSTLKARPGEQKSTGYSGASGSSAGNTSKMDAARKQTEEKGINKPKQKKPGFLKKLFGKERITNSDNRE